MINQGRTSKYVLPCIIFFYRKDNMKCERVNIRLPIECIYKSYTTNEVEISSSVYNVLANMFIITDNVILPSTNTNRNKLLEDCLYNILQESDIYNKFISYSRLNYKISNLSISIEDWFLIIRMELT